MADLSFLRQAKSGNATVVICLPDGKTQTIKHLDLEMIQSKCPTLADAFEMQENGPVLTIEQISSHAVIGVLRYIELGDYTMCAGMLDGDGSRSLLLHLQVAELAQIYQVENLRSQVYLKIQIDTELVCSTGEVIKDLCEGIRILYSVLPHARDLKSLIAHYCVSCFIYHRLGENEAFRQTVYEAPSFARDLCQASLRAGFEAEGATQIISLPVCEHPSHCGNDDAREDFSCYLHTDYMGSFVKDVNLSCKREVVTTHRPRVLKTQLKDQNCISSTSFGTADEHDGFEMEDEDEGGEMSDSIATVKPDNTVAHVPTMECGTSTTTSQTWDQDSTDGEDMDSDFSDVDVPSSDNAGDKHGSIPPKTQSSVQAVKQPNLSGGIPNRSKKPRNHHQPGIAPKQAFDLPLRPLPEQNHDASDSEEWSVVSHPNTP